MAHSLLLSCSEEGLQGREQGHPWWQRAETFVEGVPGKGDSGRVYTSPDLPLEAVGQGWGLGSCEDFPPHPADLLSVTSVRLL